MDLVFGYLAGILTLLNPCVLPVLPIVLLAALNRHPAGPVVLAAGMGASFVVLGTAVAALGPALGIDETTVSKTAAAFMMAFGAALLIPRVGAAFSAAAAGASGSASATLDGLENADSRGGLLTQALTGVLLGAVWSPCIGPTLGGAISLAAEGRNVPWAAAIMTAFALGIGSVIVLLAYGTREAIMRRRTRLQSLAERARPVTGIVLLGLGAVLFFGLHHPLEIWLLDNLPHWFQDLSVKF